MDRAAYEDYVAAFNGRDYDRLGSYYADDVEFILSRERGLVFHGRQAILELYRPFHRAVDEHVEIVRFADGGDFIAAEVDATFRPIAGQSQSVIHTGPDHSRAPILVSSVAWQANTAAAPWRRT